MKTISIFYKDQRTIVFSEVINITSNNTHLIVIKYVGSEIRSLIEDLNEIMFYTIA